MLYIHLLGHLRLATDKQALPYTALPKTTPLWSYLLLHQTQPVSRAQLATLLWPDTPPGKARSNLRRHLHNLHQLLPPAPPQQPWLLRQGDTLQWNPHTTHWLDVTEFERLSQSPHHWARAVTLYTDDLLPDLYEDWILTRREQLRHLYMTTLNHLLLSHQKQGDLSSAIACAQQLLQHDPLHEETVCHLMLLRYQMGDQAGAIQLYHQFAQKLHQELDLPPLPDTESLYESILSQLPLPDSHFSAAAQLPPAPSAYPHNIPAQLTSFLGRTADLLTITDTLTTTHPPTRLLSLTGPGGSGKTRLALEAALRLLPRQPHLFPDGIFFVDLSAVTEPHLVTTAIAQTLTLTEKNNHPLETQLQHFLRSKYILLLLDNFEQVAAAKTLLTNLLAAAPGLRLLVTSRLPLQVEAEQECPLPPLPLPEATATPEELLTYAAVALFVARACAHQPTFRLTADNAADIVQICTQLDGLPLALELAAARIKLFPPATIVTQLQNRLTFLTSQLRLRPTRQRAMRATIDWSYNLLQPPQQTIFLYLSIFAGTFTLAAAKAIILPTLPDPFTPATLTQIITSLITQNMLREIETEPDSPPRLQMLLILREYAREQFSHHEAAAAVQEQYTAYYLTLAEEAYTHQRGAMQTFWLNQLDREYDNLRAILTWATEKEETEIGLRLSVALTFFWRVRAYISEGRQWLAQLLAQSHSLDLALHGLALRAVGHLALYQSDYATAESSFHHALKIYRALGDTTGETVVLINLGVIAQDKETFDQAQQYYEEALQLVQTSEDHTLKADILHNLGGLAFLRQQYEAAQQRSQEALTIWRQQGNPMRVAGALNNLGMTAYIQAQYQTAAVYYQESLALRQTAKDKPGIAQSLHNLGRVYRKQGDLALAQQLIEEGLNVHQEVGYPKGISSCLISLAGIITLTDATCAAQILSAADHIHQSLTAPGDLNSDYDMILTAVREQLSSEAFTQAWQNGRLLTIEQAVSLARHHRQPHKTVTDDSRTVTG